MVEQLVLGIESSCDETAAAVVAGGRRILSSRVSSQVLLHERFGGVVPEIASRAHAEEITVVVEQALEAALVEGKDLAAVAVTHTPGLIGALLVGVSAAKALALLWRVPLIGVHHVEGHIYSLFLDHPEMELPAAVLVASGGHTHLYRAVEPGTSELLGKTVDDAAGEAFDKVSALLGLGYPGGPRVEACARAGDRAAVAFPRPKLGDGTLDFSFSGLKTAVLYHLKERGWSSPGRLPGDPERADIAASFQEAVVEILVEKLVAAARAASCRSVGLAGGVACNDRLREVLARRAAEQDLTCCFPTPSLCTDNAAMIAGLGGWLLGRGAAGDLALEARP